MTTVHDKTGREIMVGDVLKVFHFTAAVRRKKHYMYKQVVAYDNFRDGTPYLKVSHLDMADDGYTLICDGKHLPDYEIVQSVGVEREDEYMPIATARIAWAIGASTKDEPVVARAQPAAPPTNDLFSGAANDNGKLEVAA